MIIITIIVIVIVVVVVVIIIITIIVIVIIIVVVVGGADADRSQHRRSVAKGASARQPPAAQASGAPKKADCLMKTKHCDGLRRC